MRVITVPKGTRGEDMPPYNTGGGTALVSEWVKHCERTGGVTAQDYTFRLPDTYVWPGELPKTNEWGEIAP